MFGFRDASPGSKLNRAVTTATLATWLGAGIQILLGAACRHAEAGCSGRVFYVWLLIPQALFTVLVLRARGISWRFASSQSTPLPSLDEEGDAPEGLESSLTLPLGALATLLCGALSADALRGVGSAGWLASASFLVVAGVAATAVTANCVILWLMPMLAYSERQYSAVLTPIPDDVLR
eukprot:scaffold8.g1380.t1